MLLPDSGRMDSYARITIPALYAPHACRSAYFSNLAFIRKTPELQKTQLCASIFMEPRA